MAITNEQYLTAKKIVEDYESDEYETMGIAEQQLDDDQMYADEPCPTCGDINGMRYPCCPDL